MNSLSTTIATHYAWIEKENKKIPLSKGMSTELRNILKNWQWSQYITIPNISDPIWEPAWEWRASDVTIKKSEIKQTWTRYVCDFATRHQMNESCNCHLEYWIFPIQFKQKLWELYQDKYPSTITESEKQIILKSFQNAYKNL